MTARWTASLIVVVAAAASLAVLGSALAAAKPKPSAAKAASAELVVGRKLYRQYCGKCHALAQALAAGFGSSKGSLGTNGGPSFNNLRVPYADSVDAIAEPTGGHELVQRKISLPQLKQVATYLADVTRHNPIPALPTDG